MSEELFTQLRPLWPEIYIEKDQPQVIAGPCSAESEEQVMQTARALRDQGIRIFRAGIWKPRTRPGCFEGMGLQALPWLQRVKNELGMLTATEVATREHVQAALSAGIDILWIGARTTANPFAVQEIADAVRESGQDVCMLVKNPVNPDLELWIGALQRIYNAGVRRLGAVHRGFSSYTPHIYRNPPQWSIPLELRRRHPGIPVIFDPSHIGGNREFIAPLSQQALDMGFDGLIIESHCDPDKALSDAAQQLHPLVLAEIMRHLKVRHGNAPADDLMKFREMIDAIDDELMDVLSRRMKVSRGIGEYKKLHDLPVVQADRFSDIMKARLRQSAELGMSEPFMRKILAAIHEESVRQQI